MTDKQIVKFGDICREVKLSTKDPIADGYERYIGLEHLDSGSLKIKRWGMIAEDNPSFTRVFKKGHILFGKRRPYLKKAAIAEFDGICSGDIVVMEPAQNFEPIDLLPFIVQSQAFWSHAITTSSGSLSPRTKYKSLAQYELVLGAKDDVERKVTLLKSTKVIDDRIDDVKNTFNVFFNTLSDELLKIHPQIGDVNLPVGWKVMRLSEIAEVSRGKFTPRPRNNPIYYGGNIPFIQTGDVGRANYFIQSHEQTLNKKGLEVSKLFKKGTIFLTIAANIGDVAISTYDVACTDSVVGIEANESCNSLWLLFYLSRMKRYLDHIATESAQKNINLATIRPLKISVPPLDEQLRIKDNLLQLIAAEEAIHNKNESIKKIRESLVQE